MWVFEIYKRRSFYWLLVVVKSKQTSVLNFNWFYNLKNKKRSDFVGINQNLKQARKSN